MDKKTIFTIIGTTSVAITAAFGIAYFLNKKKKTSEVSNKEVHDETDENEESAETETELSEEEKKNELLSKLKEFDCNKGVDE